MVGSLGYINIYVYISLDGWIEGPMELHGLIMVGGNQLPRPADHPKNGSWMVGTRRCLQEPLTTPWEEEP